MSGRRAENRNRIRGPQSALTDFLAANNISAAQIRDSYEQRNRQAQAQDSPQSATATATAQPPTAPQEQIVDSEDEAPPVSSKRKRNSTAKTKPDKKPKKGKGKGKKGSDDSSDDEYDDRALGRDMYKKSKPNPGQLENCEICEKRFTVTAYSKTGPEGGLVCSPCGRDLAKDDNSSKKPKKSAPGKGRRKTESNRLDGIATVGTKTLQQLCIEKVADHHLDVEEFGDLPDEVMNRLSEIFSKRRVMESRTLKLFLRPDLDTVAIHDCANLQTEDYERIFAEVPKVKKLVLRNACQFKDSVMEYMLGRITELTHFQVYAANLITDDVWKKFFKQYGHKLSTVKLAWLDASFDDDVVATMVQHCPNLVRLKLKYCRKITPKSFALISQLKKLEHLSLLVPSAESEYLVPLINNIGTNLKTLSLENFPDTNDEVIDEIRSKCGQLSKLRLTDLDGVTDAALELLLKPPSRVPPLSFVDLSSNRDVDNNNPDGPVDNPIGLASKSFKALMAHHGTKLQRLIIPSCRHISHSAFWDAFIENHTPSEKYPVSVPQEGEERPDEEIFEFPVVYPELQEINISFCSDVDTSVIRGIFKSCPRLKKLIAFGCFKIGHVAVPRGVALIGVPTAQDAIERYGGGFDIYDYASELKGLPSTDQGVVVEAAA